MILTLQIIKTILQHLNKRQRDELYPQILAKQDGEFCNICGLSLRQLELWGRTKQLVIDRIDNNSDYRIENCQLICKSCNRKKNPHRLVVYQRELTPEMIKNIKGEPTFRRWLVGQICTHRHISYEDTVSSGAEFCGLSTETIKRYMRKLLSKEGMYELGWAQNQEIHIYEKGDAPEDDFKPQM